MSLALASQEFGAVNRGLSSAHLCRLFRETAPAPAPGSRVPRGDGLCGQEPPQHQVWLLQQGRGTYSEPVSVETGGPGTTDHVTAQASTNQTDTFDNAEARPTGPSLHPPFHTMGKARGFQAAPGKTGTDLGPLYSPVVCQLQSRLSVAEFCTEPSREVRGKSRGQNGFSLQHHTPRGVARAGPPSGIFSQDAGDVVALHQLGHAWVGWLLVHTEAVVKGFSVPETNAALRLALLLERNQPGFTKELLIERVCVALGGRRLSRTIPFTRSLPSRRRP